MLTRIVLVFDFFTVPIYLSASPRHKPELVNPCRSVFLCRSALICVRAHLFIDFICMRWCVCRGFTYVCANIGDNCDG